MGLVETAQKGAATAFKVTEEFTRRINLILFTRIEGDLENPNPDPADAPHYDNLRAHYYQTRSQKYADDSTETTTYMILTADIIALGFTGQIRAGDLIDDLVTGIRWNISRADPDPANATWIMQCR